MSVGAKTGFASGTSGSAVGGTNPWLIVVIVSVATFMEVLDTTIANVALRYISGGLAIGAIASRMGRDKLSRRQLHRAMRK
jgi:MFS transporter, DHA2 family, multidrug resistance protein